MQCGGSQDAFLPCKMHSGSQARNVKRGPPGQMPGRPLSKASVKMSGFSYEEADAAPQVRALCSVRLIFGQRQSLQVNVYSPEPFVNSSPVGRTIRHVVQGGTSTFRVNVPSFLSHLELIGPYSDSKHLSAQVSLRSMTGSTLKVSYPGVRGTIPLICLNIQSSTQPKA